MAYQTYLFSVPQLRVEAFYRDQSESLGASRGVMCSHLIAYAIEIQPLGELLGQAIDGGEMFHPNFWHPFRPPKIHKSASVAELYPKLKAAWESARAESWLAEDNWSGEQIQKLIDLFEWAQTHDEFVVSYLQPPFDQERASRVVYPRIS